MLGGGIPCRAVAGASVPGGGAAAARHRYEKPHRVEQAGAGASVGRNRAEETVTASCAAAGASAVAVRRGQGGDDPAVIGGRGSLRRDRPDGSHGTGGLG